MHPKIQNGSLTRFGIYTSQFVKTVINCVKQEKMILCSKSKSHIWQWEEKGDYIFTPK